MSSVLGLAGQAISPSDLAEVDDQLPPKHVRGSHLDNSVAKAFEMYLKAGLKEGDDLSDFDAVLAIYKQVRSKVISGGYVEESNGSKFKNFLPETIVGMRLAYNTLIRQQPTKPSRKQSFKRSKAKS